LVAQPNGRPNQCSRQRQKPMEMADENFFGRLANLKKTLIFAAKKLSRNFRREIFAVK
jgi:hypothetical protein